MRASLQYLIGGTCCLFKANFVRKKILVVDDDASFLRPIIHYLGSRSFATISAGNGEEALTLARDTRPDLLLIDSGLPGLSGHDVCRLLKKQRPTDAMPIIIMSGSRVTDRAVIAGFNSGADDYLLKPFSMGVLVVRIQAVLRRYAALVQAGMGLKKCGIELDPSKRTVTVKGKRVILTRKEFDLLAILINKSGHVLSPGFLLGAVWGYDPADYNDPRTVEVHICTLRKKIGSELAKSIVNVLGHGYKFEE